MLKPLRGVAFGPATERAKRKYPEGDAQRRVVKWLRDRPDWMVLRLENAARRTLGQSVRDTALGMRKGAPDLVLLWRSRVVWLEMKAPKGSVSPEQQQVHDELRARGQTVLVGVGYENAIAQLENIERGK